MNPQRATSCGMCNAPRSPAGVVQSVQSSSSRDASRDESLDASLDASDASSDSLSDSFDFSEESVEATDRFVAQTTVPTQAPRITRAGDVSDSEESGSEESQSSEEVVEQPVKQPSQEPQRPIQAPSQTLSQTSTQTPSQTQQQQTEATPTITSAVRPVPMKLRPAAPAPKVNIQIKNTKKSSAPVVAARAKPVRTQVKTANAAQKNDLFAELDMGVK